MVEPRPLRIVFFGTPAFSVPTFEALLASRHRVVAAVTQPDRPPLQLKGLQFVDLFVWLSWSQQAIAQSRPGEQVPLPPAGWAAV